MFVKRIQEGKKFSNLLRVVYFLIGCTPRVLMCWNNRLIMTVWHGGSLLRSHFSEELSDPASWIAVCWQTLLLAPIGMTSANCFTQGYTLLGVSHIQSLIAMVVKADWPFQSSMGQLWLAVLAPELFVGLSKTVIGPILYLISALPDPISTFLLQLLIHGHYLPNILPAQ